MIQNELPKWISELESAERFVNSQSHSSLIETSQYKDIRNLRDVCVKMLDGITPLARAFYNRQLTGEENLKKRLDVVQEKLRGIQDTAIKSLEKDKAKNAINAVKRRDNKREDSPYLKKMIQLYANKLKDTDLPFENESRRFLVDASGDYMSYLEAYGRMIGGGLAKADIVIEGEEDVDTFGYIKLTEKVLPFCLREVNVAGNSTVYHLYTFNAVTSIDDFDYDDAITDRIIYLNAKGIKK